KARHSRIFRRAPQFHTRRGDSFVKPRPHILTTNLLALSDPQRLSNRHRLGTGTRVYPCLRRLGSILGVVAVRAEIFILVFADSGLIIGHGFTVHLRDGQHVPQPPFAPGTPPHGVRKHVYCKCTREISSATDFSSWRAPESVKSVGRGAAGNRRSGSEV